MKVYELAKKLEVKSVFLMEKIRKEWKLPVKTHMETLTPDLIKKIEENFYGSQKKEKKHSPKRKKTIIKKPRNKKVSVKKKVISSSPVTEPQTKTKSTSRTDKKKFIIRRKTEGRKSSESSSVKTTNDSLKTEGPPSLETKNFLSKNIRLDLVSVKTTNPLDEEFWEEDKKEDIDSLKKQPKKPIAEKDVSSKFNATDFRKREVIFQPRKKRTAQAGEFKSTLITKPKAHKRMIKVHGEMDLSSLCKKMGLKKQALIKKLKTEGLTAHSSSILDFETIALVIPSFGFEAKNTKQTETALLDQFEKSKKTEGKQSVKPPVVTIMGHVDHGKTTLLDYIRKAKVAAGEAGGITQHLGAYSVSVKGKAMTFIDTPGHEAFTAMRSRGAQVTDIVVIVVAASDGVKPQTLEALNHAKAAKIPIIIAISKMDEPGAKPDQVKQQLSEKEVVPEDWGGDTSFIPISALKGTGIQELLEQIQLVAEVQELKCHPESLARGIVLEARKEKGFGSMVSLLIRDGTLKNGQIVVAGESIGRVRQMKNDQGQIVKKAEPGFPVEAVGFQELPKVGETFYTVINEKAAKELLALRKDKKQLSDSTKELSPEEMLQQMEINKEEKKELNIILKADVHGSLEALKNSLEKIKSEEVSLKISHSGIGAITESDILLANAVSGTVFGFNVRPDGKTLKAAKEKSVPIHTYSIIYELLDQVKKLLIGLLKIEFEEEDQGQAEIREVFHISKVGTVAGCYVTNGQITKNSFVRLVRDGRLVHEGQLSSLRRFKEDVKKVGTGFECGLSLENFNDIKPKDILEVYIKKEKPRTEL